jgi:hypothetical protein
MRGLKSIVIGMFVVGLLGCASVSVKTDYDQSVDFSGFKTYNWDSDHAIRGDTLAREPILRKRIKNAVDQVLQSKGFRLEPSGAVDFTVVIHAGVEERMRVNYWGTSGWYDPWWGPYGGHVDVSYYTQGTLVIDVVDADTRELAWRGLGEGLVREYSDNEKREADIRNTVTEILKSFPPNAKDPSKKK